jgi:hypothetical protein
MLGELVEQTQETIISYSDPRDPSKIESFCKMAKTNILADPSILEFTPEFLAVVLFGNIKFSENHTLENWNDDVPEKWDDVSEEVSFSNNVREVAIKVKIINEALLIQAVLANYLILKEKLV